MAKRHEKRLRLPSNREIQVKTTLRFHLTPVRLAYIRNSTNTCWRGCGNKGTLLHCWWECRLVQSLWKSVWRVFRQLPIGLLYESAILLLGIYTKEIKIAYEKGMCNLIFTAAQSTITKTWKQPRCQSKEE